MPIRQVLSEDAAAFQQLRLRGLAECPEAFSSSHAEEVDLPLAIVSARLAPKPNGAVWGYFDGTELSGLIGVQRAPQKQLAHKADVWGMYVAPTYRRKGLGRALLGHAIEYAANVLGVRSVNLGVTTTNEAAVGLYKSMGFEIYGTEREFLLVNGIFYDQHLMTRRVHAAAELRRLVPG
jgi:ribosomal protein S18 acetylase RimI-like enzyme